MCSHGSAEGEDRANDEYGKCHYQGDEVLSHSLGGIYGRIAVKILDKEPNPCCDRHQECDRPGKPQPDPRGTETPLPIERRLWRWVLDFFGCHFSDLPSVPKLSLYPLSAAPFSSYPSPKRWLSREVPALSHG